MARVGKIARLPQVIREELNQRLRAGQLGPQLLPWLNELPEVQAVLTEFFDGAEINAQNLSDWRNGGYKEWDEKQDRHWQKLERTRELASMSMKLAQAGGGNLSEGAAAMLGGEILVFMEELDQVREKADGSNTPEMLAAISESFDSLVASVSRLRRGDHDKQILRQNDERLRQKDQELSLAREKFQRDTAEWVLKSARDEAVQRIASTPMDHTAQLNAVGKHIFGELWK